MSYIERKQDIIDHLTKYNVSNIDKLSKSLFVSKSTLRRDLIALENEGIIKRYHGGVTLAENRAIENAYSLRTMENSDKKMIISRIAKNYIKDNMVLFIDSSSTVSYLCPYIMQHKNIKVITNGINVATLLNTSDDITCYICPGKVKEKSLSIIGEHVPIYLNNFRADICFFSSKAISLDGIYEGDQSQALCKKSMIKNASTRIFLCDSTKEEAMAYYKLSDFSDIDIVISNDNFSDQLITSIEKINTKFVSPKYNKNSH